MAEAAYREARSRYTLGRFRESIGQILATILNENKEEGDQVIVPKISFDRQPASTSHR
jgi:hypothetical protein